ncbi:MAG: hypothetical protein DI619_00390 [Francisella sp.]|nr:MAG: hypothetical protein DI619_00390 [Francisella sp.]
MGYWHTSGFCASGRNSFFTAPAAVAATSAGGILGDHIGDKLKEQREIFIRKNIKNSKELNLTIYAGEV